MVTIQDELTRLIDTLWEVAEEEAEKSDNELDIARAMFSEGVMESNEQIAIILKDILLRMEKGEIKCQ